MWCRYFFFLVSPNSDFYYIDEDDWENEYNCKFTKSDRPCINISGRQTGKSEYTLNGIKAFSGTGVGLHVSSVYDIPYIPTKNSPKPLQVLNIMEQVYGNKPKSYFGEDIYTRSVTGITINNGGHDYVSTPTIIFTSTPSNKKGFFAECANESVELHDPIYGANTWANFNLEANMFAELPKYTWDKSGWRTITGKDKLTLNFR